eukprot:TRINITY_DN716_c0_g1_i1.p1 TRINITY_DN716_c0_g1~~TRINITY_DN716_c0_g1_i1.p1  ORF type:complete len:724 (-),score=177.87 TRINITY_DN716_c0_g1_i1:71-2209(-)
MAMSDRDYAMLPGYIGGAIALLFSLILVVKVLNADKGNQRMIDIAQAIQIGAQAFLKREYTYLSIFVVAVAILLFSAIDVNTGVSFLVGAIVSAGTGYFGMQIAVRANVRTTAAAQIGLNPALRVAFNSGSTMGFSVVGLGLFFLSVLGSLIDDWNQIAGFGMGASSIALFARVGGGIFTKAADVGSDLVGKVEAGIPEDDPRNPGTIADNVGDNVGDVAGMGADLFESYVGSIIAACTIGFADFDEEKGVALPFLVSAFGIICSMIGSQLVQTKDGATQEDLLNSIRRGTVISGLLIVGVVFGCVEWLELDQELSGCIIIGLVAGVMIGFLTEYCTSFSYWPVISICEAGHTGPATVIIQGMAVGMWSAVPPVLVICVAILACYELGDIYGVAIAPVGMLSTLGITLATDAYGPVADNAGGIAEMAELPKEVRERTDALDALGNTTAATGKGFAIGSAVLTALALMTAFTQAVGLEGRRVDLVTDVEVLPGILIGVMLPFLFASLTMTAVGKAAGKIITEIRRQFKEIPGLLEGTAKADYAKCVDISTTSALHQMIFPGMLAVVSPIIIGFGFGPKALAGLLAGSISGGFLLAVTMSNAGGAWDNAKKYCEAGNYGGKKSETHKALVTGDTVGDPFKDTSGPSLNILIKLMSIVALVLANLFEEPIWWVAVIVSVVSAILSALLYKYVIKDDPNSDLSVILRKAQAGQQSA